MEVGTMAMDHLVRILQTDRYVSNFGQKYYINCKDIFHILWLVFDFFFLNRTDTEILGYALDTLYNIVCSDEEEEPGMFIFFILSGLDIGWDFN